MAKLRLIYDATKTVEHALDETKRAHNATPDSDDEFARKLLTAQHGPHVVRYLILQSVDPTTKKTFKKKLREDGYFTARLPAKEEPPMWFIIAMRFLSEQHGRWTVEASEVPGYRIWRVTYLRHGHFKKKNHGAHLRIV